MKYLYKILTVIAIVAIGLTVGCSKKNDTTTTSTNKSPEQLLDNGKWVMSSITLTGPTGAPISATSGTFSVPGFAFAKFMLSGFTFSDAAGNGKGTLAIDSWSAGATYTLSSDNQNLAIYFNSMNGAVIGGNVTISATQLTLNWTNTTIFYYEGADAVLCSGFTEILTH